MRTHVEFIGFRATQEERAALNLIAEREERSPSDVLRRLIRQAVKDERQAPTVSQAVGPGVLAPTTQP